MTSKIRKKSHSAEFKFKVAVAALKEEKTTAELCQDFGIVSSQVFKWKRQLLDQGFEVFKRGMKQVNSEASDIEKLHAVLGKLKVQNDFLERLLGV